MSLLLKDIPFECRVSSVLNKDVKSYGKKYMFDDNNESCWNSDSGIPQWVFINFEKECQLSKIEIEFQGGFVGQNCHVESGENKENLKIIHQFYPEDTNTVQQFKLVNPVLTKTIKIVFNSSTDFFGRIIIYKLSLYS